MHRVHADLPELGPDPHHLRVPVSDAPGGQKRGRPQPRQLPAAAGGPGQPQWLH
ncbi:Uncharacterised protein [Chlamydia trachomatis]|nr:Uncharacterised protein [Chlamydia trachomatis]